MLPHPEQFDSQVHYYSTLLHELTHATGHASRLNREAITCGAVQFGNSLFEMSADSTGCVKTLTKN